MRLYQVGVVEDYAAWKRDYFSAESKASRKEDERRIRCELVQDYRIAVAAMKDRAQRWEREYEKQLPLDNDALSLVMEALADGVEPFGVYGPNFAAKDLACAAQTCKQMYRAHHAGMKRLGNVMARSSSSSARKACFAVPRSVQHSAQTQTHGQTQSKSPYNGLIRGESVTLAVLKEVCRDLEDCKVTGDKDELMSSILIQLGLAIEVCTDLEERGSVPEHGNHTHTCKYQARPTSASFCTVWACYAERQSREVYERYYPGCSSAFAESVHAFFRASGQLTSKCLPSFYAARKHLAEKHGIASLDALQQVMDGMKYKKIQDDRAIYAAKSATVVAQRAALGHRACACAECHQPCAETCSAHMCGHCCKKRRSGTECVRHLKFFR